MPESWKIGVLAPPEQGKTTLCRGLLDGLLQLRGPTCRAFIHDQVRAPQYPGVCVTSLADAGRSPARRLIFREPVTADEVARFALRACGGSGRRVVVVLDEASLRQVCSGGKWASKQVERLCMGERGADLIVGAQVPKYIPTDFRAQATDWYIARFDDEDSYKNLARLGIPDQVIAQVRVRPQYQFVHYRRMR